MPTNATAVAHPNIALVKYWGKQRGPGNVPATPSLSVTLAALSTVTTVTAARHDELHINGEALADAKVHGLVTAMRTAHPLPPIAIATHNDFPTGAGLASSASGLAALVTAIDGAFDLGLSSSDRSLWARSGSASAARSIYGGFATLTQASSWAASPLLDGGDWPLEVVIAVTSEAPKRVPSTAGMALSQQTSPFYGAWLRHAPDDFDTARHAVAERDFDALAAVAEHSCLKLHALMLSTRPALLYWNAATLAAIEVVRNLRDSAVPVFFTIDAGPQVKAVCAPGSGGLVAAALRRTPGVLRVIESGLGAGARLVDAPDALPAKNRPMPIPANG